MKLLLKRLFNLLSFVSLGFQQVRGKFAHFDGVKLGTDRIVGSSKVAGFILHLVVLSINDIGCVMLIKYRVHVEEVNLLDINFIDVLAYWISGTDAKITIFYS